ncbi:pentapeptide repeat-containing protein [Oscillatoriales cyanobacterium LEGE 11467]|uniref:Pentapeptide repeat-containing protein n=1 Tax=Zarconia navalis LEGE 11467 TaxID=1828826 RepID=A0A928W1T5_9CYAN|nr:pentapeptide repeat-containing protein [Zarconia navalis]MBE9041705.1 pentapeptide repeat-containing protein [Zarconia navalis LEGE 11467]
MTEHILSDRSDLSLSSDFSGESQQNTHSINQDREEIYRFFLEIVKKSSPDNIIEEFKQLFVYCHSYTRPSVSQSIYNLIFYNDEEVFRSTFKRCCYILVNNWSSNRQYKPIQDLIKLLERASTSQETLSFSLNRLRNWLLNFVNSVEFQELQLFASFGSDRKDSWSQRYTSYLLASQYLNAENPLEQREIARKLAQKLKLKFKFDLAMYVSRCDRDLHENNLSSSITQIQVDVIHLIKTLVPKHLSSSFNYYAEIFNREIENISYQSFKKSLQNYLILGISNQNEVQVVRDKLFKKIDNLYVERESDRLNFDLCLRTCKRTIEFITTETNESPSDVFILINTQGTSTTIVFLLLKIILICKHAQSHLDIRLAKLIRYYEKYPEDECQWFIKFLEIFKLVFAIYTDNIQYNLVKVKNDRREPHLNLEAYRLFPQLTGTDLRNTDLAGAEIHGDELRAADLRGADLRGADLSRADLSLAKLSDANLCGSVLDGCELTVADLNRANLSGASLQKTDLRRADLQDATLVEACLSAVELRRANLQNAHLNGTLLNNADLSYANLAGADLSHAELHDTDLSHANLAGADLSHASLAGANLSHANLTGANLSHVNFCEAHLISANFAGANLSYANFNHSELRRAKLHDADLSNASVRRAILNDTCLKGANLTKADLSYSQLIRTDLGDANLCEALLRHVNVRDAKLDGANLKRTNLFGTNISQAKVKGARFRENSGFSFEAKEVLKRQGAIMV